MELASPRNHEGLEAKIQERTAELSQANQELQHQAYLLANVSDAIIAVDRQGFVTAWNHAAEEMYGWPAAAAIGHPFAGLIDTTFIGIDWAGVKHIMVKKGRWRGEVRHFLPNGTALICEVTTMALKDKDGPITGYVGVIRDITRRKQMEQALYEREHAYRTLAENLPGIVYRVFVREDHRMEFFNKVAETVTGYKAEELRLGRVCSIESLILPEDRARVITELGRAVTEDKPFMVEYRLKHKDGSLRHVVEQGRPIRGLDGGPLYIDGVIFDITERRQAESRLRLQAQIIDQIHDAVVSTDLEGYVTSWKKGAERLFGYSAEEALGRHISFVYAEDQYEFLQQEVIKPLKAKGNHEVEVQMYSRSGEAFYTHLSLSLLRDSAGVATGMIGYSMDISEKKRAEAELKARARQQATVANLGQHALADADLTLLMDEAVRQIAQTLEVEYCKVLELLPEGEAMLLRAGVGWQDGLVGQAIVEAATHSQAGYTLLSNDPVIVEDLRTETRFKGPTLLIEHDVVSGISTIIRGQGQPFGILGAHTNKRRIFNQDDVHFLEAVANVLAMAIERKGAEKALESYVLRLELLHKIDRAILTAQSPAEIANAALEDLRQSLALCERASVSLFDFEANEAIQLAVINVNNDTRLGAGKHIPLDDFVDIGSLQEGLPHRVVDIEAMDHLSAADEQLLAEGLRSYINVPLISQGQLIGSLNLGANAPGAFSAEQVDITHQVADPLAIAIQQARLFEQLSLAHTRLQSLSRRLVEAEEMERRRIAHDLHDEIGQALTAVQINLQGLQGLTDQTEFRLQLEENINLVKQTLQQVRQFSLDLRPSSLDDLGLIATLRWYVDRQAQRGGFAAQFRAEPLEMELPPELEITCFRVVQEALTNVLRHAQAQQVRVELRQHEAELGLTIQDDGVGFDVKAALNRAAHGASLGLLGMQERVRLTGGQVDLQARFEQGTTIRVRFPLVASSEAYRTDFQ